MRRSLFVIALLFLLSLPVIAADVSLAWDASTSPNVTSYRLYWGKTSFAAGGSYTNSVTIPSSQTTYTVAALAPGITYFAVTALNAAGSESAFSNEVSAAIKEPAPAAPGNLKITVIVDVQIK